MRKTWVNYRRGLGGRDEEFSFSDRARVVRWHVIRGMRIVRSCIGPALAVPMIIALISMLNVGLVQAQSKNIAFGFTNLPKGTRVVVMPTDIELFSISGGGVAEPKADWTEAAARHFKAALVKKQDSLGVQLSHLNDLDADDLSDINALHAAVARAIALHHFGTSAFNLPTKDGKLDWSMGDSVKVIKEKTGADYALFSWVRDSYASGERVASMVVLTLLGVRGMQGGSQAGYASLVDLNTGAVLWFNRILRRTGDLREEGKAAETLDTLLEKFPVTK